MTCKKLSGFNLFIYYFFIKNIPKNYCDFVCNTLICLSLSLSFSNFLTFNIFYLTFFYICILYHDMRNYIDIIERVKLYSISNSKTDPKMVNKFAKEYIDNSITVWFMTRNVKDYYLMEVEDEFTLIANFHRLLNTRSV